MAIFPHLNVLICDALFLQVQVETADVLHWPIEDRIRPLLPPGKRAKCVANLPYNITTSTLKKLLPLGSLFSSCTLMLQEEAAERLVNAAPGDSEYRAMSFFVNFYAEPRIAFRVNKSAFTPQPKCDSAVVVMGMRTPDEWQVASPQAFFWLVRMSPVVFTLPIHTPHSYIIRAFHYKVANFGNRWL